jgi:hypothetical protein
VHVVHCVDTEGPLEEPLDATFTRLRDTFGIALPASLAMLEALQQQRVPLGGLEREVAAFIAPSRLAYLDSWQRVEEAIVAATDPAFRRAHADSNGAPYRYSWFVIDVVGYVDNPRRKAVGFHAVWDAYQRMFADGRAAGDAFGWHFHTVPVGGHALHYNTSWTNNDWHEQSLARRLIERGHFPALFRAGGAIERLDVSFWLEQFIPFDFSNRASSQPGAGGPAAECDWRGAPEAWLPYHPDFRDYRRPGGMHRAVFRCLDIDVPDCRLTEDEVRAAFTQAEQGGTAVLAYTDHDRRDIRPNVGQVMQLIRSVAADFPHVEWRHANALDAARASLGRAAGPAPVFTTEWQGDRLDITVDQPLFGPSPFLAVEELGGVFLRDNVTKEDEGRWSWRSSRPSQVVRVGVAGSNEAGAVGVQVIPGTGRSA